MAQGHAKYTAQFYGLPALFRPIEIQRHRVVSGGDPIELELSNKYVVKGIRKEQVVDSVVRIHVGADGRIERLEDRWNGKLPEGAISEVSSSSSSSGTAPADAAARRDDDDDTTTPPPPSSSPARRGRTSDSGSAGGIWVPSPLALARWAIRTGSGVAWWGFCTFSWWWPFLVGAARARCVGGGGDTRLRCWRDHGVYHCTRC